jgi:hypothetical protein
MDDEYEDIWGLRDSIWIVSQGVGVRKLYRLATPQCVESARRDLRCLNHLLITGDTLYLFIFFRLQYSDSNHSANFFASL